MSDKRTDKPALTRGRDGIEKAEQTDFLELFTIPGKPRWTRSFPLYDALPKFLFTNAKKMTQVTATVYRELSVTVGECQWNLSLTPAHVPRGADSFFAFPGEREELVARALRYLAVQQRAKAKIEEDADGRILTVFFTLYQLQEVLAQWDHTYSAQQLDEALTILRRTGMTLKVAGQKKAFFDGTLIQAYSGVDESEDAKDRQRWVVFSALEVDAIVKGDYRALNFQRVMSLESPLARALFEYVMREHRNAEKPDREPGAKPPPPFRLALDAVFTHCCIQPEKTLRNTVLRVRAALQELAQAGVLWPAKPFEEIVHHERGKGRPKIKDVCWLLYLSREDVSDMIAAHAEAAVHSADPVLLRLPAGQRAKVRSKAKSQHL